MDTKSFYRLKTTWENEADAFADILQKQQELTNDDLEPAHEEERWVWKLKQPRDLKYSKAEFTEKAATDQAIIDFDTFEGNLEASHTKNYYVFSKIRG